jgi:hypothetical protein
MIEKVANRHPRETGEPWKGSNRKPKNLPTDGRGNSLFAAPFPENHRWHNRGISDGILLFIWTDNTTWHSRYDSNDGIYSKHFIAAKGKAMWTTSDKSGTKMTLSS